MLSSGNVNSSFIGNISYKNNHHANPQKTNKFAYCKAFGALKGVEYLGIFNPCVKPIDLEVIKALQESAAIKRFSRNNNVTLYIDKNCKAGEYTSRLTFAYKNTVNSFKGLLKNIFTPQKEINLIYKSKETSAEHSKVFTKMIKELDYITLEEMSKNTPKHL